MIKKLIRHINLIGHEINQSIEDGYPESDREIYCKRLNTIKEPNEKDCIKKRYLGRKLIRNVFSVAAVFMIYQAFYPLVRYSWFVHNLNIN